MLCCLGNLDEMFCVLRVEDDLQRQKLRFYWQGSCGLCMKAYKIHSDSPLWDRWATSLWHTLFWTGEKCVSISLEAIFAEWWYKAKLSWERVKAEWKWHRNKSSLLCKSITWSFAPFCSLSSDNKVFYNFGFPLKTLRSTDEVKMISWKLANSSVKGECFGQICKK